MQGCIRVNESLELPELKVQRKVKSLQMFKQPVPQCQVLHCNPLPAASCHLELLHAGFCLHAADLGHWFNPLQAGDRVGICVTQMDPKSIERGLACTPGSIPTFSGAVAAVEKIRFHLGSVDSKSRVHVTVGHHTVMARVQLFGVADAEGQDPQKALQALVQRTGQLALKATSFFSFVLRRLTWRLCPSRAPGGLTRRRGMRGVVCRAATTTI